VTRWIERLLAHHEPPLTPGQYLALRAIAQEDVGSSELARRTGVSSSAVSQLVAGLSDVGLIERVAHGQDRRRQSLRLTNRGEQTLQSARNALQAGLLDVIAEADVPPPEAHALARGLPHLEATLAGTPPPRRPAPPPPPGGHPPHEPGHRPPPPTPPRERR
jgi:DNA-binding MarR family transcriptional regulator